MATYTNAQRRKMFERKFLPIFGDEYASIYAWLDKQKFFEAPASVKYHGNYAGGLFDHSWSVMTHLAHLTEDNGLAWDREESPYIVGMFHDLCKIDAYTPGTNSGWEYNSEQLVTGHGDKSVMLMSFLYKLTSEEMMCIRYHMGAFTDKEEWKYYSQAVKLYPNVLWTHTADMLASQVSGI